VLHAGLRNGARQNRQERAAAAANRAMKVALLCNLRPDQIPPPGCGDDAFEEYDTADTIEHVAATLRGLGVEVEPVEADRRLPWRLEAGGYDFAFNMAEGAGRRCREAIPAAVCELLGIPFTGSDVLTLTLALDKATARRVVSPDVPVARAALVTNGEPCEPLLAHLRWPAVVKPNDEGSSKGIRSDAFAIGLPQAAELTRRLRRDYRCPVLVEEYLHGAEITAGIIGNGHDARVIGIMEIAAATSRSPFLYSLEAKREWRSAVRYHVPARLDPALLEEIERLALRAYALLGCRDVARLDFRLDAQGRPHFLECNPLPGLHPESGDLAILSRETLPYDRLVQGILLDAAKRHGVTLG
jgi:D-alanine-D-alanine ligase